MTRRLPLAAGAATAALAGAGYVFIYLTRDVPIAEVYGARGASGLVALPFGAVGVLVTSRRPRNPLGWLYLVSALSMGFVVFGEGAVGSTS